MKLILIPLDISDIDDEFTQWHQNDDGHLDYFTGSRRSFSRETLLEWVSEAKQRNTFFYLIAEENGDRIGTIKVGPVDTVNKTSDLVCLIGNRSYLGRGLAKEAIALGNKIAFEDLDIRRLQGGMYEDNVPSIKAYTRAGWVIEGRMKGYYWVDGKSVDRVCVACFNPKYFPEENQNEDQ